jgi:hypothetical protein
MWQYLVFTGTKTEKKMAARRKRLHFRPLDPFWVGIVCTL